MKAVRIERAIRQISDVREDEILCSECFDRLSDYVDREIAGEAVVQNMPEVKYHFDHCGVCREEYETLRDLARLEAEGRAPSVDDLKKSL